MCKITCVLGVLSVRNDFNSIVKRSPCETYCRVNRFIHFNQQTRIYISLQRSNIKNEFSPVLLVAD